MDARAKNICRSIEGVSKALAEWTVSAQFEADPTVAHRYGLSARRRWVSDTQTRLGHLAQALSVRSPDLFVDSILWMRAAFDARGSDQADLALNLRSLRSVIAAELPATVTETAVPCVERAIAALADWKSGSEHASANDPASPHSTLAADYLAAMLAGNGPRAAEILLASARNGAPVRDLYLHVLHPAMAEIGRLWQSDEIGVADEHYASATTQMVMSQLRPHFVRRPFNGRRMLATACSGDLHDIGVRMVGDFFDMGGWEAIYLGANMPASDLITTIIERDAALVALSASSVVHMTSLGETIEALRATPGCERVRVLVGGPPFNRVPSLWEEIGADGFAHDAEEAVAVGDRLVGAEIARA